MAVEFHAPSPLVPNRKCYLARYSRRLRNNVWGVVDVSLESLFPNPLIRYRRRPSGCLIERFRDGLCKVRNENGYVTYNITHENLTIYIYIYICASFLFHHNNIGCYNVYLYNCCLYVSLGNMVGTL